MTELNLLLTTALLVMPVHAQTNQLVSNGVHKTYYANGQIQTQQQFKNGQINGYVKEYYPSGKLAFLQSMKDGNISGDVKAYYENGTLKGQTHYINNYQDGISKEYYPSGKVKEEVTYIDGQIMDLKQFDEKGNMAFHQTGKFDYGCAVVK